MSPEALALLGFAAGWLAVQGFLALRFRRDQKRKRLEFVAWLEGFKARNAAELARLRGVDDWLSRGGPRPREDACELDGTPHAVCRPRAKRLG